jgi:cell division protein FtsB
MIASPLIYFGSESKPDRCEAEVFRYADKKGKPAQCSSRSKAKRLFSDGQEHACCGQHARQYDKLADRVQQAEEQRKLERELIIRVGALNVDTAKLYYTLTGRPTNRVLVDLDVLERTLRYLHERIEKLEAKIDNLHFEGR